MSDAGFTGEDRVGVAADDGTETGAEAWFTVTVEARIPGDSDGNGVVDIVDLVRIASAFDSVGEGLAGDVTGDGVVNIVDLVTAAAHFGEGTLRLAPSGGSWVDVGAVREWLRAAETVGQRPPGFERGVAALQQLLMAVAPADTRLLAPYPNPFNPETWIPFRLSRRTDVRVTIYSPLGQVVRRIDLGSRSPGVYRARGRAAYWDGRNDQGEAATSGVYFVELRTDDGRERRRIVLRK